MVDTSPSSRESRTGVGLLKRGLARFSASPVSRRLASGVVANALGKAWVLLQQLIAIPVLTAAWGAEGYGIWLMLITIPTYIALSDFGFGTAATVDLTRKVADGDHHAALQVFQSAWGFVSGISVVVGLLIPLGAALLMRDVFAVSPIPAVGILAPSIVLVVLYALLIVQTQLISMGYRATNKYAKGTFLLDGLVFAEGLVMLAAVLLGADMLTAAALLAGSRAAILALYYAVLRRDEPWLRLGFGHMRRETVRRLASPSLGAIALSVANSFVIQGVVLTLGVVSGAAVVAAFATARFITRIPLQFSGLLTRASIPELTRALHSGEGQLARRLLQVNVVTTLLVALPFSLVLLAVGPQVASLLSHGQLTPGHDLFLPLVLAALVSALWASLATPLIATNRHATFSYLYLAASLVAVVAPFVDPSDAQMMAAWALLCAEAVALAVVVQQIRSKRHT